MTSIAPLLNVRNGRAALRFYERALGAEVLLLVENGEEVVARLAIEGAEFWLADESPDHLNFSPAALGGASTRIVLVVEDPAAAFERAIEAGASLVWPVAERHGWLIGRLVDPFGHHWEIGRPST
jgi:PhnB protein